MRSKLLVTLAVLSCLVGAACGSGVQVSGPRDESGVPESAVPDLGSLTPPVANQDHWHAAYAVFGCDGFGPPLIVQDDPVGIHSHGDGVVHIHPFIDAAGGANATLGVFFEATGVTIDEDGIDDNHTLSVTESEDTCDGEPGVVQVAVWDNALTADETEPRVVTEDIDEIRFTNDLMAITIAFVPEGSDIPPPPTIPFLGQLSDIPPGEGIPIDPSTATSTLTS